jgi:ankyrin repeat protein
MARSIIVTDDYLTTHLNRIIFINEEKLHGPQNVQVREAILQHIPELTLYPENRLEDESSHRAYLAAARSIFNNTICGDLNMGYILDKVSKSHAYIKISTKESNKLCGFALLNIDLDGDDLEIFAICADKTYKGVGTYMIDCILKLANKLTFTDIKLHSMTNAVGFYLKNGFGCAGNGCSLILSLNNETIPHTSINPSKNNEGKQRVIEKSNAIIQRLGSDEELDAMNAHTANMIAGLDAIAERRKTITAKQEAAIAEAALAAMRYMRTIEGVESNWTPGKVHEKLNYACETGKLDMLMHIVDAYPSVNLNHKNGNGRPPLLIAMDRGSIDMVKYLWEKGADINVDLSETADSLLRAAISGGSASSGLKIDCLYFLLAGGPNNPSYDRRKEDITKIYYFACALFNADTLEYLITQRIINVVTTNKGLTLLLQIFSRYNYNIVGELAGKRLIRIIALLNDLGADFVATTPTGQIVLDINYHELKLYKVMIENLKEVVQVHEARKITGIEKRFLDACKCSGLHNIKDIFDNHPNMDYNVEEVSNTGKTGLMYACRRGDLPLVQFLLEEVRPPSSGRGGGGGGGGEFRIDINKKTEFGVTAFSEAILGENIELIDYLYEQGADFSIANDVGGMNLLHLACSNMRSLDVIKRLVEQLRIDPDGQDSNGDTPLVHLLKSPNTSIIRRLELIEYLSSKFPTGYVNFKYTLRNGDSVLTLAKALEMNERIISFIEKTAEKSRKSSKAAIEKKQEVAQLLSEQSQVAKAVEVEEVLDSSHRSTKKAKPNASGSVTRRNSPSRSSSQGSDAKKSSQGSATKQSSSKGSAKTLSQGSAKKSSQGSVKGL